MSVRTMLRKPSRLCMVQPYNLCRKTALVWPAWSRISLLVFRCWWLQAAAGHQTCQAGCSWATAARMSYWADKSCPPWSQGRPQVMFSGKPYNRYPSSLIWEILPKRLRKAWVRIQRTSKSRTFLAQRCQPRRLWQRSGIHHSWGSLYYAYRSQIHSCWRISGVLRSATFSKLLCCD